MSYGRKYWIADDQDGSISVVSNVQWALSVTFFANEITGYGFGDVIQSGRAAIKMRLVQAMLAIATMEELGTNVDENQKPLALSFMYKREIPKMEAFYETLPTVGEGRAGWRFILVGHDPKAFVGNGVGLLCRKNAIAKEKQNRGGGPFRSTQKRMVDRAEGPLPGTQYMELDSLSVWQRWLAIAFFEKRLELNLTLTGVANRDVHLSSPANPGCPDVLLSLQRDVDPSNMPPEVRQYFARTGDPVDPRFMDWASYRPGARPAGAAAGTPQAAKFGDDSDDASAGPRIHVPGVYDGEGDDGAGGRGPGAHGPPPPPPAAPPENLANGFCLTFPDESRVYRLGCGPQLKPERIFQYYRPDMSEEGHIIGIKQPAPPSLIIQERGPVSVDSDDALDDGVIAAKMEAYARDAIGGEEGNAAFTLLENLAKLDDKLRLKLRFAKERMILERELDRAELTTEERSQHIRSWKIAKLGQVMDYVKIGSAQSVNSVIKDFSRFYKETIDKHGTLAMHRVCSDPTLSTFGNLVAQLRAMSDKVANVYTAHNVVELLLLAMYESYHWHLGMGVNAILPGNAATSKTFITEVLMEFFAIDGTIDVRTKESACATQLDGDTNGLMVVTDETSKEKLGVRTPGGFNDVNGAATAIDKSVQTKGYQHIRRVEKQSDGSFATFEYFQPHKQCDIKLTNEQIDGMDAALRSRYMVLPMPEDLRDEGDLERNDVFNGQWSKDVDLIEKLKRLFKTIAYVVYMVEFLIEVDLIKDVDDTLARHWISKAEEEMRKSGLPLQARDLTRMKLNMRSCAIMNAAFALVASELGSAFKAQEWNDVFLFDVEPLLVVTDEMCNYVKDLHAPVLIPFDTSVILKTMLAVGGNEQPLEDAEGKIVNADAVDFKNRSSLFDPRRDNAYDYVVADGTVRDLVHRVHRVLPVPRPPLAVIFDSLNKLMESMISVRNRDAQGTVIDDDRARVVPQGPRQAGQQMQITGVRASERSGTHQVKGLLVDTAGKKVLIPLDAVLRPPDYTSVLDNITKSATHKFTRVHDVLSGRPLVVRQPDGSQRRYSYLLARETLRPSNNNIIKRRPFETIGVASLLYADTEPTAFFNDPRNADVAEWVCGDFETLLFEERAASMPDDVMKRVFVCIPAQAEKWLPKIHAGSSFTSCVPSGRYPDCVLEALNAQEAIYKVLRADPETAMARGLKNVRIRRSTNLLARLEEEMLAGGAEEEILEAFAPSSYMRAPILRAADDARQNFTQQRQALLNTLAKAALPDAPRRPALPAHAARPHGDSQSPQGQKAKKREAVASLDKIVRQPLPKLHKPAKFSADPLAASLDEDSSSVPDGSFKVRAPPVIQMPDECDDFPMDDAAMF